MNQSLEGAPPILLPKGLTQLTFGAQWKRGNDRRDEKGVPFHSQDRRYPDFRYAVMNMGFGLGRGLELNFTIPYTWATDFFETPRNFYSRRNINGQVLERCQGCTGITDTYVGLKWQAVRSSRLPVIVQGDFKLPEFYRHSNPYLGSRAHDFHLSAWTVLRNRRAWVSPGMGYLWRGGGFADGVTYVADMGFRPFPSSWARGFYLRTRLDGSVVTNGEKAAGGARRFRTRHQLSPGRFFTYNDQEGHRITWAAGFLLEQWNVELAYSRWLAWKNSIGFKEWSLAASRPLADRQFIRRDRLLQAPTPAEARARHPNSIVLAPGEGFMATFFDWKRGQRRHDDRGRFFRTADGRRHDFRFLTTAVAYGLPKGFEVSALVPYLWGKEAFEDPNRNFSHTGLNDIWISVRKQLLYNSVLPLGVAAEFKFPEATRHADRWLGELRHDIMLSLFTVKAGRNWWVAPKFGYKWREGAFADEAPYVFDAGYRPSFSHRFRDFYVKALFDGNFSLNNASPPGPKDRFGPRRLAAPPDYYFTFNEGAQHRAGFGIGFRLLRNWNIELVNHEYIAWKNNNGYERDWTIGFSRWF